MARRPLPSLQERVLIMAFEGVSLAVWVLAAYGLTLTITGSKICEPLRRLLQRPDWLKTLVHCPMCMGFWVGVLMAFVRIELFPPLAEVGGRVSHAIVHGFCSMASCWIIHVLLVRLGSEDL